MNDRGWCDIGYHFVIDRDGKIYEARSLDQRGAHVGTHNTGNIGISLIGCYGTSCPQFMGSSPAKRRIDTVGCCASRFSAEADCTTRQLDTNSVRGHNEWPRVNKDCPGANVLSRMAEIRAGGPTGSAPNTPSPAPAGPTCHAYVWRRLFESRMLRDLPVLQWFLEIGHSRLRQLCMYGKQRSDGVPRHAEHASGPDGRSEHWFMLQRGGRTFCKPRMHR